MHAVGPPCATAHASRANRACQAARCASRDCLACLGAACGCSRVIAHGARAPAMAGCTAVAHDQKPTERKTGHINDRTRRVPLCLLVSSPAGLVRAACVRRIAKLATLLNALCLAASSGLVAHGAIEQASKRSGVVRRPTMLTGGVMLKSHKAHGRQAREHVDLETSNRPERVGNQASSRACKRAGEASGQTVQNKKKESRQGRRHSAEQASTQASKQASERASKQASKQASDRASKRAGERVAERPARNDEARGASQITQPVACSGQTVLLALQAHGRADTDMILWQRWQ
jgi:hypothetical protein